MIGIIKVVWEISIIFSQGQISDYNPVIMGCLVDKALEISEAVLLVLVQSPPLSKTTFRKKTFKT
jgi:hypothetical protein